jgi:hypothetical protein
MRENTQQRSSRIAHEDSCNHREHANAKATYKIVPSIGYLVFEITEFGQLSTSVNTIDEALEVIKKWSAK